MDRPSAEEVARLRESIYKSIMTLAHVHIDKAPCGVCTILRRFRDREWRDHVEAAHSEEIRAEAFEQAARIAEQHHCQNIEGSFRCSCISVAAAIRARAKEGK